MEDVRLALLDFFAPAWRQIQPRHVRCITNACGENIWVCIIPQPKVKGLTAQGPQKVAINEHLIDKTALHWIRSFADLPDSAHIPWDKVLPRKHVIATIRNALGIHHDGVVHHSLRHGGASYLHKIMQLSIAELQPIGRWASPLSCRVYIHM